jgi:hypothetical protein
MVSNSAIYFNLKFHYLLYNTAGSDEVSAVLYSSSKNFLKKKKKISAKLKPKVIF